MCGVCFSYIVFLMFVIVICCAFVVVGCCDVVGVCLTAVMDLLIV